MQTLKKMQFGTVTRALQAAGTAGSKAVTTQEAGYAWHSAVRCGNGLSASLVSGGGNADWRACCPQNANQWGVSARFPFSGPVALGC